MEQEQPPEPDHAEQQPDIWHHHNPDMIVLPVETRPIDELRAGARRTSTRERKRPASFIEESYQDGETVWEENGELVRDSYDQATQCSHGDRRQRQRSQDRIA